MAHKFILASSPPVTITRPDFCPKAKHVTADPWATNSSKPDQMTINTCVREREKILMRKKLIHLSNKKCYNNRDIE